MRRTSPEGIALIKHFEGLRLSAYRCSAGVLTIGYGSTRGVYAGMKITQEEADARLVSDLQSAERSVLRLISVPLTVYQFDALVSFTFNLGGGALQRSTLRQKINRGEHRAVPAELMKWIRAGGKKNRGLYARRKAEGALYAKSVIIPYPVAEPQPSDAEKRFLELIQRMQATPFTR